MADHGDIAFLVADCEGDQGLIRGEQVLCFGDGDGLWVGEFGIGREFNGQFVVAGLQFLAQGGVLRAQISYGLGIDSVGRLTQDLDCLLYTSRCV